MMETAAFNFSFPNRTSTAFGSTALGRLANWLTTTWWRFDVFFALIIWLTFTFSMPIDSDQRFLNVIFSIPGAILLRIFWVWFLLFASFIPVVSVPFALARISYYVLFSRLIIQPAPKLELPLWFRT